jgi:hypothetical protein
MYLDLLVEYISPASHTLPIVGGNMGCEFDDHIHIDRPNSQNWGSSHRPGKSLFARYFNRIQRGTRTDLEGIVIHDPTERRMDFSDISTRNDPATL